MKVGGSPYASAMFQGDINEAVVKVQKASGLYIDKAWWDANVGDQGNPMEVLKRFDDAYKKYIESIPDKEPNVLPGEIEALQPRPTTSDTGYAETITQDLPTQDSSSPDDTLPPPDYSNYRLPPESVGELPQSDTQQSTLPPDNTQLPSA